MQKVLWAREGSKPWVLNPSLSRTKEYKTHFTAVRGVIRLKRKICNQARKIKTKLGRVVFGTLSESVDYHSLEKRLFYPRAQVLEPESEINH